MPSQDLLCWNITFHNQTSFNLVMWWIMGSFHLHILLSSILPLLLLLFLLHPHSHLFMLLQITILGNIFMVYPTTSIISIPMAFNLLPPCPCQFLFLSLLISQGTHLCLCMHILGFQDMPLHTMTGSCTTTSSTST